VNTHCTDNPHLEYCNFPEGKQFKKFLIFVTDCWPVKYAKDVFEHYQQNAVIYHVFIPGAKYSHAIYTAYLTGQLPTNYKGEPIKGDHLVKSLLRAPSANYKFKYIGPEWSFLAIFGKDNYDTFFTQVQIEKEALDIPYQHPYPFFFENGLEGWDNYFRELNKDGLSMFAHSGVFDHRQHGEHRGLGPAGMDFPRTDKMAKVMQSDLKQVKRWIDANPEYLLILLSDHGVDEYGIGGYRMHGEAIDGNEPFILLYNPTIEPKREIKIDVVDVAATLSMYLEGVDIPANSLGITQSFFGENQTEIHIKALKRNLVQLGASAKQRGLSVDTTELERLLALPSDNNETVYRELQNFALKIKNDMFTVMDPPYLSILFYTCISSFLVLFILIQYNEGLERFVLSNNYWGFGIELLNILIIYGLMFLQLLYCWWAWGPVMDGGVIHRILSPALAFMTFYQLRLASRDQNNRVMGVEKLIYRNEMINLYIMFLTSIFPDLLSALEEIIFFPEVMILVGAYCVHVFYTKYMPGPSKYVIERGIAMTMLLMIHWYVYTSETQGLYLFWHFHICALGVFLGAIGMALYFFIQGRLLELIVPINLVLYLLYKESSVGRCFLILFNVQYLKFILPVVEYARVRITECSFSNRENLFLQPACITLQAAVVYLINQTYFSFAFSFGNKVNLDVHPFAGRIGMNAYDLYPGLSAFLMAFHKYGIFSLLAIFAFHSGQLKIREEEGKDVLAFPDYTKISHWLADLMTCAILLLYSLINLGLYLMLWAISRFHPNEQATSMTLLIGVMGAIYSVLHIRQAYKDSSAQQSHSPRPNIN